MSGRGPDGILRHVGFIGAMTENFCDRCNRARMTADGSFQACLGGEDQVPLRELLRAGEPDALIAERVRRALGAKASRHHMEQVDGSLVRLRPMMGVGG